MSLYKRGDVWWYEFVFSGERIRESTKQSNKRVAEQMEAAARTKLAKEGVGIVEPVKAPTLADYAKNSFLPHVEVHKAAKANTLAFYKNSVRNLLTFEKLAQTRLDKIDVPLIDQFILKRREAGMQVSTVNRDLATLRRMLNLVPKLRADLKHLSMAAVTLQSGENRRERVISPEEEKLYLDAAAPLLKDVATIIFDCGFRPEEVFSLKWSYVRNGNIQNFEGKTERARRSIPATDRIMEIFERRFADASSDWVFPAPTQTGHIGHDSIKKQHAAALVESKVKEFVPYSLRHTCLTRWAEADMNPYDLMRMAGHAELSTTMRYVHMAKPIGGKSKEVPGTTKSPHRANFTLLEGGRRAS